MVHYVMVMMIVMMHVMAMMWLSRRHRMSCFLGGGESRREGDRRRKNGDGDELFEHAKILPLKSETLDADVTVGFSQVPH